METTTIWAVSSGEYSDYDVNFIFEAKEDAERYAAGMGDEYRVEAFNLVPSGMPFTTWKRLTVSWREHLFMSWDPNPEEREVSCSSLQKTEPMPQPKVSKGIWSAFGSDKDNGYLTVEGDDHERVRKVFTEQLAGFKLELPLRHAAAKQRKP